MLPSRRKPNFPRAFGWDTESGTRRHVDRRKLRLSSAAPGGPERGGFASSMFGTGLSTMSPTTNVF